MKRTSFMAQLNGKHFVYKENLGELCSECNECEYQNEFKRDYSKQLNSGDTKGHYHNTELMIILSHWKEWYDVSINRWIFLETGKVKFTIDSYHAQITHAIKRYVKLGYEIASSEDIKMAIKGLSDTHIANLQPNRDQDTDAIENLENKMNELVN
ncbi:hypothetical protein RclHR1_06190019 [Rhizophagus clarus]|uniref:Uncharacterized protein n=1 Tax=Rhizophagus clarus TaxID=94130 RepID=A0A2Z6S7W1_9GLOM|nr:hypothetical protein RclHR1_06190019 [Rhizophagus clarus]